MSAGIIEQLLELLPVAPEPNCTCHLSPPCGDCVDWRHQREVEAEARAFLAAAAKPSLPAFDPSKPSTEQKLYHKFGVYRIDGSPKHQDCEYFVLDLTHDPHARPALAAYATAAERTHPLLASDLRERYELAAQVPDAIGEVLAELERATRKFPTWPTDPLHAVAVVGEESGELTKAVLQAVYEPHKSGVEEVRSEAIQTAAMAIRFLQSMDAYAFTKGEQHEQAAAPAAPHATAQVPDEFVLVPKFMHVDAETMKAASFIFGGEDGEFCDTVMSVGFTTDDDGKQIYGLYCYSADYPEEGTIPLFDFAAPANQEQQEAAGNG